MVRGTDRLQNDLNCVDGDIKPQQNKQFCLIELSTRPSNINGYKLSKIKVRNDQNGMT